MEHRELVARCAKVRKSISDRETAERRGLALYLPAIAADKVCQLRTYPKSDNGMDQETGQSGAGG